MAERSPVEFYFDFVSPYAYFASTRIDALAAKHGRTVDWKPVLIGVTIMGVMGMKPLMETPLKSDYLKIDGPRSARLFGVPFKYHGVPGLNSLAAERAFLWIKQRDAALAVRFAKAVFARVWAEGRDITPPGAVAEVGESVGVPSAELLAAVASEPVKQALRAAVDEAVAKGVFGVPFFIADGEPIWGSDRLAMLEHWLERGSWDPA
jgi:2-hydroxychromene-2-carboxylate isomerase